MQDIYWGNCLSVKKGEKSQLGRESLQTPTQIRYLYEKRGEEGLGWTQTAVLRKSRTGQWGIPSNSCLSKESHVGGRNGLALYIPSNCIHHMCVRTTLPPHNAFSLFFLDGKVQSEIWPEAFSRVAFISLSLSSWKEVLMYQKWKFIHICLGRSVVLTHVWWMQLEGMWSCVPAMFPAANSLGNLSGTRPRPSHKGRKGLETSAESNNP